MPFVRSELEHWPLGVPAVPDADLAVGKARHLDTVAVGETQGTLNPDRTFTRLTGCTTERRVAHVCYLTDWGKKGFEETTTDRDYDIADRSLES